MLARLYLPIARSSADLDTNLSDMLAGSGTATPQTRVISIAVIRRDRWLGSWRSVGLVWFVVYRVG